MTTEELLEECLEVFDAFTTYSPAPLARKLLKERGTPHKVGGGTSSRQLAKIMATLIREHLGRSSGAT